MAATVLIAKPLFALPSGKPVVYEALGACFYLEALVPEDAARLEAACALVQEWLGPFLRWADNSAYGLTEPFRPAALDFVSSYAENLDVSVDPAAPFAEEQIAAVAYTKTNYALYAHGGAGDSDASPYSFRFFAVMPPPTGPRLAPVAMLRVTVPPAWPLDDFRRRVIAIAEKLRLRWAAAGFLYSGIEDLHSEEYWKAVYGHARRRLGFDVGSYVPYMIELHDRLRTVSWLTFVGPALQGSLAIPPDERLVQVVSGSFGALIVAGESPQPGDLSRLDSPRAYVEADRIVRAVRLRKGIHFMRPFDERTTEEWLRRFELRLS